MKPPKVKTSTPDLILTAAERVVLRDGVMRLTLEAVAREAKLSKGGLLYHFATKDALIQAMLERLIRYCEREIEVHQQRDAEPGRWTRAYVRRKLEPVLPYPGEADFPRSKEMGAGLIVAATTTPGLLDPLRERFQAWQHAIEQDGIGVARATVVRLAVDGLWLAELLGIWSPSEQLRVQVLHELIQLTKETPQARKTSPPRASS
jgi:AcrR family transcriptional regulator